jgi:uncharacterized protein YjbJ (UPF0337 family)
MQNLPLPAMSFATEQSVDTGFTRTAHQVLPGSPKENHMDSSTKDQVAGKAHELKGKLKETIGHATDNPEMEADGQAEKVGGTVQKKVGQVEKVLEK